MAELDPLVVAGEKLGSIVPPGERRAVTQFPVAAVGRLRPGQPARLRLEGFPWTQYGMVGARVAEVGNEPTAGLIRVELLLGPDQTAITVQTEDAVRYEDLVHVIDECIGDGFPSVSVAPVST